MKELLIECCPPGLYFKQIALSSIEELESVKTDMFVNQMVADIETQWQPYGECKWAELYSPTWSAVKEQLPKVREGLKLLCQERCPTCKAVCIYHSGHTDRHDCYHQPSGQEGAKIAKKSGKIETSKSSRPILFKYPLLREGLCRKKRLFC